MKLEDQVVKEFRTLRGGSYCAIHKWLVNHYGKADRCENPSCDGRSKTYQWALRPGHEHAHDRTYYQMLCASCHRRQDQKPEWAQKQRLKIIGRAHTAEHRQRISEGCQGVNQGNKHSAKPVIQKDLAGKIIRIWDSAQEAATALSICPTGISMCCKGHLKKSGGFAWNFLNK